MPAKNPGEEETKEQDGKSGATEFIHKEDFEYKSFDTVRNRESLVRSYPTPPGDRLYAYRVDEDGALVGKDEAKYHVVISRGDEPATRWKKIESATVEHPVEGLQRWTIPDNWDRWGTATQDTIAYGLFHVPESDVFATLSIPTNDWLVDAWYGVKKVGSLSVTPVGELGSSLDVRNLARQLEEEGRDNDAEAFRALGSNWDVVEKELNAAVEWVRDEGLDNLRSHGRPLQVDERWHIEFSRERIFRPTESIQQAIDTNEYDIPANIMTDHLNDEGLLPDYYRFALSVDSEAINITHCIRGLVEAGATATEAVDYCMTELAGDTQQQWANSRGVAQPTVSENVSRAQTALSK